MNTPPTLTLRSAMPPGERPASSPSPSRRRGGRVSPPPPSSGSNRYQVSKAGASGEFVARGAFVIHGTKNFLRDLPLELGLGEIEVQGESRWSAAPPEALRARGGFGSWWGPGRNANDRRSRSSSLAPSASPDRWSSLSSPPVGSPSGGRRASGGPDPGRRGPDRARWSHRLASQRSCRSGPSTMSEVPISNTWSSPAVTLGRVVVGPRRWRPGPRVPCWRSPRRSRGRRQEPPARRWPVGVSIRRIRWGGPTPGGSSRRAAPARRGSRRSRRPIAGHRRRRAAGPRVARVRRGTGA